MPVRMQTITPARRARPDRVVARPAGMLWAYADQHVSRPLDTSFHVIRDNRMRKTCNIELDLPLHMQLVADRMADGRSLQVFTYAAHIAYMVLVAFV